MLVWWLIACGTETAPEPSPEEPTPPAVVVGCEGDPIGFEWNYLTKKGSAYRDSSTVKGTFSEDGLSLEFTGKRRYHVRKRTSVSIQEEALSWSGVVDADEAALWTSALSAAAGTPSPHPEPQPGQPAMNVPLQDLTLTYADGCAATGWIAEPDPLIEPMEERADRSEWKGLGD